jgi:hypothetical protein
MLSIFVFLKEGSIHYRFSLKHLEYKSTESTNTYFDLKAAQADTLLS